MFLTLVPFHLSLKGNQKVNDHFCCPPDTHTNLDCCPQHHITLMWLLGSVRPLP